jgi:5-methylcytosine-specific restriction endonuclease McrA
MSHTGLSSSSGVSRPSESTRQLRTISGLSDRELLFRVKDLVARERSVTLEILVHLIEVERRRLHLGLGYASKFDYCTRHLGYSSSAASRRIHSARCVRDYPEVYGLLEKNVVNLSSVSLVASILTKENKDDLLKRIQNKSQKEVEAIVADYRPPVSLRDRARPVCVAVSPPRMGRVLGSPLFGTGSAPSSDGHRDSPTPIAGSEAARAMTAIQRTSECDYSRCGSEKTPNMAAGDSVGEPPRLERKFQVQFLASEQFMKKFEKAKALLSNKNGNPSYEAVLEAALDEFLKDHDPEQRKQRREERRDQTKSNPRHDSGASGRREVRRVPQSQRREDPPRRIPAATRDAVYARDNGRCTFVGSTGKRCETTHNLQVDHIVPYARGGTATLHNLRLLCERHNKHEAERVFGANATRRFRVGE